LVAILPLNIHASAAGQVDLYGLGISHNRHVLSIAQRLLLKMQ
jgi:hypothetical protein